MKKIIIALILFLFIIFTHSYVWADKSCSKKPTVVAIIDTGIDLNQKDLQDWLVSSPSTRWNFTQKSNSVQDHHGHGTHIAGILIQQWKSLGIFPQSCPSLRILPLKYYDTQAFGESTLENSLNALRYAIEYQVDIINYSGGGSLPSPLEFLLLQKAKEKNIILVAAAGNDGRNTLRIPFYPAGYPLKNIVTVGALNEHSNWLESSNFGQGVDISTFGENIISTIREGKLAKMTGTSQATAFVTAALAARISLSRSPTTAENQIYAFLESTYKNSKLKQKVKEGRQLELQRSVYSQNWNQTAEGLPFTATDKEQFLTDSYFINSKNLLN